MGAAKDNKKAKDQAMAARMRDVTRGTGRCPVCHNVVGNGSHITSRMAECRPHRKGESGTNAGCERPA